jgi:hypothetical protein
MAVINPTVDLNPYTTQLAEIERRKRMAALLQQQGMEPLESQTVGGRVIPISPWQVLAKALQTGMGAYQSGKAGKAESELQDRMAYDQRSQEAEESAASKAIQGRMFGQRDEYTKEGKPVVSGPTVSEAAPLSSGDQLQEITPTGQYKYDPQGALQMAMTPSGMQAMQKNTVMASMLANMAKPKEPEEFGTTPVLNAEGEYMLPSKSGRLVATGIKGATKEPTGTNLARLIAERDALPANSPSRAIYEAAIKKETERSPGVTVNMGNKAGTEMLEHFGNQLDTAYQSANASTRTLNVLDRLQNLTKQGTYTGAMAPNAIGAAQFLESFGIKVDPKVLANSQAFEAAKNDLVLQFMSANGGARGFTEKESAMLYDAFPKLVQSPEARSQIIDALRSNAEANITDYNSKLMQFQNTYKGTPIPYKSIETPEMRYERWKRSQQGGK